MNIIHARPVLFICMLTLPLIIWRRSFLWEDGIESTCPQAPSFYPRKSKVANILEKDPRPHKIHKWYPLVSAKKGSNAYIRGSHLARFLRGLQYDINRHTAWECNYKRFGERAE
jgi:hypothetical protein